MASDSISNNEFHVIHSNDLDSLSVILSNLILKFRPDDAFTCVDIIIPNNGMREWLDTRIAQNNGISMRNNYHLLWNYIWTLFNSLGMIENSKPQERYRRQNMVWNIFSILPDLIKNDDTKDIFKSLRDYVVIDEIDGDTKLNDSRLYQLSEVIADIIDGYVLYRSDWLHLATVSNVDYSQLYKEFIKIKEVNASSVQLNTQNITDIWKGITVDKYKSLSNEARNFVVNNIWQVILWKKIVELNSFDFSVEDKNSHLEGHLANMIDRFIAQIPNDKELQNKLPKVIFIFGISALPPLFIKMFKCLSHYCNVLYFLPNPCKLYWGDIKSPLDDGSIKSIQDRITSGLTRYSINEQGETKGDETHLVCNADYEKNYEKEDGTLISGNSLLVSWGKQGRDNLYQLVENMSSDTDIFIDPWDSEIQDKDGLQKHTVLAAIQHDILTLTERNPFDANWVISQEEDKDRIIVWEKMVNNIQIHSAYTPIREVESAYDYILHLFDSEKNLKPNDIVVMTPNINTYAPFIDAVFGVVQINPEKNIPYVISDQTYEKCSSFFNSFFSLMQLPNARINGSLVLDLLSVESIAKCFDITSDELITISNWIDKVCIRGDFSEKELQNKNGDLVKIFSTWSRSFDRLFVGATLPPNSGIYEDDIFPYTDISSDQIELLAKLKNFVFTLNDLRDELRKRNEIDSVGTTVENWKNFVIDEIIDKFYLVSDDDSNDGNECSILTEFLRELSDLFKNLGSDKKISLDVFTSYLKNKASKRTIFHPFMSGKVNFCSFVPMRSIPFKHIIMLGMNGSDFPRNDTSYDFDLLRRDNGRFARIGDRSSRNDDRYMFLETLLSAKKSIYISYIGRSVVNNSIMNPSTLVSELQKYISKTFILDKYNEQRKKLLNNSKNNPIELNCELFKLYKNNEKDLLEVGKSGLMYQDTLNSWDEKNYNISHKNEANNELSKSNSKQFDIYRSYLENTCPLSSDPIKCNIQVLTRYLSSQLIFSRKSLNYRDEESIKALFIENIKSFSRSPFLIVMNNGEQLDISSDFINDITCKFFSSKDYKTVVEKIKEISEKNGHDQRTKKFKYKEDEIWSNLLRNIPSFLAYLIGKYCEDKGYKLTLQTLSFDNEFSTIITDLGVKQPKNIKDKVVTLTLKISDLASFMQNPTEKLYYSRFGVSPKNDNYNEKDSDDSDPDQELMHSCLLSEDKYGDIRYEFESQAKNLNFNDSTPDLANLISSVGNSDSDAYRTIEYYINKMKYTGGMPSASKVDQCFKQQLVKNISYFLPDIDEKNKLISDGYKLLLPQEMSLVFDLSKNMLPNQYRELLDNGIKFRVIIKDVITDLYFNEKTQSYIHWNSNHVSNLQKLFYKEYVNCLFLKCCLNSENVSNIVISKENDKDKKYKFFFKKDVIKKSFAKSLLENLISLYLLGMQSCLPLSLFSPDLDFWKNISTNSKAPLFGDRNKIEAQIKNKFSNNTDSKQLFTDLNLLSIPSYLIDEEKSIFEVLKYSDNLNEVYFSELENKLEWNLVLKNLPKIKKGDFSEPYSKKPTSLDSSFIGSIDKLPMRKMLVTYYMLAVLPIVLTGMKNIG